MRVRIKKRITIPQLFVCGTVGTVGGIYFWQPLLKAQFEERKKKEEAESAAKENSAASISGTPQTGATVGTTETKAIPASKIS